MTEQNTRGQKAEQDNRSLADVVEEDDHPSDVQGDSLPGVTGNGEEIPPSEIVGMEETDTDETLNNNREERRDWSNIVDETTDEIAEDIEQGSDMEARSLGGLVKNALGIGARMQDQQDQIEENANRFRMLSAARKAYFETNFGDREEQVSIDADIVEEQYGEFRSQTDLALDEVLPMAWERDMLERSGKNSARLRSTTGHSEPEEVKRMEEHSDLWLYNEGEAEEAKDEADSSIRNVLDEVNVEGQALELRDRKEAYDEVKEVVDSAIETVQEADDEVSMDVMAEEIQEAAEDYGLDIDSELDEETVQAVREDSQEYIDNVAADLGVEDQITSSVTTDITEFFDEDEVDPIEAARLLKATVADATARQLERYETAVDSVEQIDADLDSIANDYDEFTSMAEDLTNVKGVQDKTAQELRKAGIDTVFDLAEKSQRRFNRMTDAKNTRGGHAENLVENAQTYVETELAHELGLEDLREQMEETLLTGDRTSIQYGIREQARSAYEAADTVMRYVNGLQNTLPGEDSLEVMFEEEDGRYKARGLVEKEREEVYNELGLDPADLDNIDFLEDTQDIDLGY